jgi:hypothetical protein
VNGTAGPLCGTRGATLWISCRTPVDCGQALVAVPALGSEHGHPPSGWAVRAILSGVTDPLSFTCPRCGTAADDRYYGPCAACRTTLRRDVAGEARAVEDSAYEPKMNVTPNAVALKDD